MNHHIGILNKIYGNNDSFRYSYILSQNDLYKAYAESRHDLTYRLKKEVKRDRFVLNTDGLQEEIESTIDYCFKGIDRKLMNVLEKEINQLIDNAFTTMSHNLNGKPNIHQNNHSFASELGRVLGNAISKSAEMIYKNLTDEKKYNN